jgi:ketosteroid isomerase-like protein
VLGKGGKNAPGNVSDEAAIGRLIDSWATAISAKDVNGSLANYAPGVLAFDLINPLQYAGSDALRTRLANWFSSFEGPIGYEIRELNIATGRDVAFSHSLNHVDATTTAWQKIDMWWRATICFRRIDGEWMVTHSHTSVPFDMETGKASLDLRP